MQEASVNILTTYSIFSLLKILFLLSVYLKPGFQTTTKICCFPSYKSEYSHRAHSNHGGVAIYINSATKYKRRHDLELNVTDCESVWVQLNHNFINLDNKNFIFGCIYRSPSSSVNNFCEALHKVFHTLALEDTNVVIMEDFNINLLDLSSPSSLNYCSASQSFGYECLISLPTRCINGVSTLIDHALSNLSPPPDAGVLTVDITDHYSIFLRFTSNTIPTSKSFIRDVFDKESFIDAVERTDWPSVIPLDDPQVAFSVFFYFVVSHSMPYTEP